MPAELDLELVEAFDAQVAMMRVNSHVSNAQTDVAAVSNIAIQAIGLADGLRSLMRSQQARIAQLEQALTAQGATPPEPPVEAAPNRSQRRAKKTPVKRAPARKRTKK